MKIHLSRSELTRLVLNQYNLPSDTVLVIGAAVKVKKAPEVKAKKTPEVQTLRPVYTCPEFARSSRDEISFNSIVANITCNNKIGAIKELRTMTGWGLKDAKDAVEDFSTFCNNSQNSGYWRHL